MKVEICINSDHHVKQSVEAAYHGGADSIELCSRMDWELTFVLDLNRRFRRLKP